ncbi:Imm1 family immunity protein [Kitasatospora sp. NPDC008115]|uniref:Imm1 family immunity protein n=1 Tax=Kitasatospora sp. NPDC008115 TaxID=3364022 RepID=UPI0036E7E97D
MVLNARYDMQWRHADNWNDASSLIDMTLAALKPYQERRDNILAPGTMAMFCLAEHPLSDGAEGDSTLLVSANSNTGFGALIWYLADGNPLKRGIFEHAWISDNPQPPEFDPRVVSDSGYPLFHDRASTLPISKVRAALEEFARTGTGERPECISWTLGNIDGQRHDRAPIWEFDEEETPF